MTIFDARHIDERREIPAISRSSSEVLHNAVSRHANLNWVSGRAIRGLDQMQSPRAQGLPLSNAHDVWGRQPGEATGKKTGEQVYSIR